MPRSGEEARRRLQQGDLGTVPDARLRCDHDRRDRRQGRRHGADLRHFPDKREALFDGEEAFRDALAESVIQAPEDLGPMDALLWAFRTVEPILQKNRAFSEPRWKVIAQTPPLQERVLMKTAGLVSALSAALRRRGVEEGVATLASQAWMAVFSRAASTWLDDPAAGIEMHLVHASAELRRLSSNSKQRPR